MNDRLPKSVRVVASIIGREDALRLVAALPTYRANGGRRVVCYVPKRLPFDHILVRVLGWPKAQSMVEYFGGDLLFLANCKSFLNRRRNREIINMLDSGKSPKEVAAAMNLTDRHVRNLAKGMDHA